MTKGHAIVQQVTVRRVSHIRRYRHFVRTNTSGYYPLNFFYGYAGFFFERVQVFVVAMKGIRVPTLIVTAWAAMAIAVRVRRVCHFRRVDGFDKMVGLLPCIMVDRLPIYSLGWGSNTECGQFAVDNGLFVRISWVEVGVHGRVTKMVHLRRRDAKAHREFGRSQTDEGIFFSIQAW